MGISSEFHAAPGSGRFAPLELLSIGLLSIRPCMPLPLTCRRNDNLHLYIINNKHLPELFIVFYFYMG